MRVWEFVAGGPRNFRGLGQLVAALLAATAFVPVPAGAANTGSEAAEAQPQEGQEIIVTGQSLFRDIQPERQLDQDAIDSYGASTVDELLEELQTELGDVDESPMIFVNGERLNSLDEIGAFPIEVLENVQVLPRGSAVRVGGSSSQRVISLTTKRSVRTATLGVAPKVATDGDWHAIRGEAILTRIQGQTRMNLALKARDESNLLEIERGIIQPEPRLPFALDGNVIGLTTDAEIDPLLSLLAGEIVTVAPFPDTANPTLADFVANANQPAVTDIGQFRTLRPSSNNYDLNGTVSTPLAPWLKANATIRLTRNVSRSLRGLPGGTFLFPADSPFSPFSPDVRLAIYGTDPLRFHSQRESGEGNLTLNGQFGKWLANLNLKHNRLTTRSRSLRQATFGNITLDDDVDPFSTDLTDLIELRENRTSSRGITTLAELSVTGPALTLPAGPVQTTIEGRVAWNRLHSRSSFSSTFGNGDFKRDVQSIRGAVDIPLTSRALEVLPAIGDLGFTAEYSRSHYSDAGSLDHYALGLTWEPVPILRLRALLENTEDPPTIQLLGDPVIITPDVRIFDPLTGQTVDVTQITGGNPDIGPQKTRLRSVSAILRLVPRLNLQLNAEYTDLDVRDFVSSLPESSAAIMLAFPDRFIRDSSGVLTTVDLRPVNFESHREKRLRWGFSLSTRLGSTPPPPPGPRKGPTPPPTMLQLTANHTMVFSDRILIRPGLESVDLLGGGAIGIGGGRMRNQFDGTAAINSGGIGARLGVTWRGPFRLESRIGGVTDTLHFSPVLSVNLRAFADMKRFFPREKWAKGLRLSLEVQNLFNDRQNVRDSFGATPLQYQPGYRDPLGRTIEFEIRKVF